MLERANRRRPGPPWEQVAPALRCLGRRRGRDRTWCGASYARARGLPSDAGTLVERRALKAEAQMPCFTMAMCLSPILKRQMTPIGLAHACTRALWSRFPVRPERRPARCLSKARQTDLGLRVQGVEHGADRHLSNDATSVPTLTDIERWHTLSGRNPDVSLYGAEPRRRSAQEIAFTLPTEQCFLGAEAFAHVAREVKTDLDAVEVWVKSFFDYRD